MNKKKIFWALFSLLIAGLSIWAVTAQNKSFSLADFERFVRTSNKFWLAGAFLCMFGFIWFEGIALIRIAKALGYPKSKRRGTVYGAADVYFSAITPSATGGQPASAFFMMKDGMPGTVVTVTLLANLIMYTLALLGLGIIFIIFRFDIFLRFTLLSKILIISGFFVLGLLAFLFYMLLRHAKFLYSACDKILSFLEKIHILKNGEKKRQRLSTTMSEYKQCSECLKDKKSVLFEAFIWNLLQRLSQFGVAFMVFMAAGTEVKDALKIWAMQCFVSLGSNCVPIPGAMGVADYIMLDAYRQILNHHTATNMELLCRGISFYGCILISGIIVLCAFIIQKIRSRKC